MTTQDDNPNDGTAAGRSDDHVMIAATETARRNPMRPPDTLPRDAGSAIALFLRQPSPQMIALFVAVMATWRLSMGPLGWKDAAACLAVLVYFPFNEWLIHVYMLHFKPTQLFGRTIDFYLPVTHRRHHADPWNLSWTLIPRHVHMLTIPIVAVLMLVFWPRKEVAASAIGFYLVLGLHYEWSHYLAHIPWCPPVGYYQRRVREHRYHHFRNENYWWGVSMGLADRIFGTAPAVETIGRTGTTSTLHAEKPAK